MPVERPHFPDSFNDNDPPSPPCPSCDYGHLHLSESPIAYHESASSKSAHQHPDWEPEWISGRFVASFQCNNENCGDTVICSGAYSVSLEYDDSEFGGHQEQVRNVLEPQSFLPSPPLIKLPEKSPETVTAALQLGFGLLWLDPAAAANRIRYAVEELLTHLKVAKTRNAKGKRLRLSLHERIEKYGQSNKELADRLMAIKWIGNFGTHTSEITRDEVFDGLDLIESVLARLYDPHERNLTKLTDEINRAKKPIRKRPRKK